MTEGDAAIDAEPFWQQRFAGWDCYPRIGLRFEGLRDRQGALWWDMARALLVARAGQRVFISRNDGCYQVPNDIICDRVVVPAVVGAKFLATMVAYLCGDGREDVPSFLAAEFDQWWGSCSPDYRRNGLEGS